MLKNIPQIFFLYIVHVCASYAFTSAGLRPVHCQGTSRQARSCRSKCQNIICQEKRLGDVVMQPCKKLCFGCEPWICPLAPKDAVSDHPLSDSSKRLLEIQEELAREAEIERKRLELEAMNAGIVEIESESQWRNDVMKAPESALVVALWGSKDCRKCKALKPKYIKLAADLCGSMKEGISFYYVDARGVGNTRVELGVRIVPLLQCWRNGLLLDSYLAEGQLSDAEVKMRELVVAHF